MKRRYELTVIISPQLSLTEIKKVIKYIESLIGKYEGKVVKAEDWGQKELMTKIKKQTTAFYRYFEIEIEGTKIKEIDREFKLEENILRYLFVASEK